MAKPIDERAQKIADELQRRKQLERYRYYEVPPYFRAAVASPAHTKLMPLPNRVGKSTMMAFIAYWYAMDCFPDWSGRKVKTPNITWLLGPTLPHVREVLIAEMIKWGLDKFWEKYSEKNGCITWKNGSKTYVKSYDDRKNIQGRSIYVAIIDEECSAEIFYELMMRSTADCPLELWVAATPLEGEEWFADLCERAEKGEEGLFICPEITIYDAAVSKGGHLTDAVIKRIEQLCVDEMERQVRLFGKRVRRAGSVLLLDENVHRVSAVRIPGGTGCIPDGWLRFIGVDPHARKPTSVVWVALNPDNGDAYVYDHMKVEGTVEQQAGAIKERSKGQTLFAIYLDPAAKEAMSSNLIKINWNYFDEFMTYWPQVPCVLSIKSRPTVIDSIKYRLSFDTSKAVSDTNRPHLYILDTLEDLWRSLKQVRWKEFKDRNLLGANTKVSVGKDDDMMALGYALVMHPLYVNMVSSEKEEPVSASEAVCPEMGY